MGAAGAVATNCMHAGGCEFRHVERCALLTLNLRTPTCISALELSVCDIARQLVNGAVSPDTDASFERAK